jgi:predicted HNH restriction endonuclease
MDIVQKIGDELPKYVLMKDGTLLAESSNKNRNSLKDGVFNPQETFLEGALEILLEKKRQKRNDELRVKAIEHYGLNCHICGFNFEDMYGKYGAGYIEIHHLSPLADSKGERESTVYDVRVVCSNCHSVLHHQGRVPLNVDELKAFVKARHSK